jgi:DNA-binding phage protein
MNKKKILKKREFTLDELQPIEVLDESKLHDSKASEFFKNKNEVAKALLECLIDNDTETFMEILDAYLSVNRTKVAQRTKLTRATVTQAFSKKGNPTLKTIAKIVHEAVTSRR